MGWGLSVRFLSPIRFKIPFEFGWITLFGLNHCAKVNSRHLMSPFELAVSYERVAHWSPDVWRGTYSALKRRRTLKLTSDEVHPVDHDPAGMSIHCCAMNTGNRHPWLSREVGFCRDRWGLVLAVFNRTMNRSLWSRTLLFVVSDLSLYSHVGLACLDSPPSHLSCNWLLFHSSIRTSSIAGNLHGKFLLLSLYLIPAP